MNEKKTGMRRWNRLSRFFLETWEINKKIEIFSIVMFFKIKKWLKNMDKIEIREKEHVIEIKANLQTTTTLYFT